MSNGNELNAYLRQILAPLKNELVKTKREVETLRTICAAKPRTITEEIDAIPGRRLFYNLSAAQAFDISLDGKRGQPLNFLVSQDGPFIMTHYPMAMWRPASPDNATDIGRWRPVSSWPLPDQVVDEDIIDISYEMADSGSQRNFQNLPASPGLLSRPDNVIPVPVPTLFTPNTVIQFTPTYENILFNTAGVPPDSTPENPLQWVPTVLGVLVVTLPGYRIVNM